MEHPEETTSPGIAGIPFEFLVDKVSWKDRQKPSVKDMPAIRNRLASPDSHVRTDIECLERFIQSGFTIMPAICHNGTKKENWIGQQLFFLDFDNDPNHPMLEPLDAMQRAFDKQLYPLFLYFTHSATIEPYNPRFRMVFSLKQVRGDMAFVQGVGMALLKAFPEADPASIRPTQMFFSPGKEVWPCWKML